HLVRRIRFDRARPAAAMLEARATLRRNELVALTAGAWEGAKAVTQPFLGGTLKLATGPVRLASIARSTLLPVAAARVGRDSYEVRIEKPIDLEGAKDEDQLLRQGFAQFAAHVGENAVRWPAQWRGWSSLSA